MTSRRQCPQRKLYTAQGKEGHLDYPLEQQKLFYTVTLLSLPNELLEHILSFIDDVPAPYPRHMLTKEHFESFCRTKTLISLSNTCKSVKNLLKDDGWKRMWNSVEFCRGHPGSSPNSNDGDMMTQSETRIGFMALIDTIIYSNLMLAHKIQTLTITLPSYGYSTSTEAIYREFVALLRSLSCLRTLQVLANPMAACPPAQFYPSPIAMAGRDSFERCVSDLCVLSVITLGVTVFSSELIIACPNVQHVTVYDPDDAFPKQSIPLTLLKQSFSRHLSVESRTLLSLDLPVMNLHRWLGEEIRSGSFTGMSGVAMSHLLTSKILSHFSFHFEFPIGKKFSRDHFLWDLTWFSIVSNSLRNAIASVNVNIPNAFGLLWLSLPVFDWPSDWEHQFNAFVMDIIWKDCLGTYIENISSDYPLNSSVCRTLRATQSRKAPMLGTQILWEDGEHIIVGRNVNEELERRGIKRFQLLQ